jgi:hypothetical protein
VVVRHNIWRRVEFDYRQARERKPDGYEPVVRVYVAGRAEPITLGFVETRKAPDEAWVRFEAAGPGPVEDDAPIPPSVHWLHVPEGAILGVEISFVPTDAARTPVGFRLPAEEAD